MDVGEAILARRAYRAFKTDMVSDEEVRELAEVASLSPSCFNNQPWRFIFVRDGKNISRVHEGLNDGNRWAKGAPMIVAAFSRKEDDCVIGSRSYHEFDLGLSVGFMILKAQEMGLVAHPLAGYDPDKVAKELKVPEEYNILALIVVGRHSNMIPDYFTENQRLGETQRPPRKGLGEFAYVEEYGTIL
jgi:nitroreductase